MSRVEVTVRENGTGQIAVDGHDVSNAVLSFNIDAHARQRPRITLHLNVEETRLTGEMDVRMPSAVAYLLQRAGWKAPERPEAIEFKTDKEKQ